MTASISTKYVKDFEWGAVRIVNLYSTVIMGKPSAGMLTQDIENVAYIEDVLEEAESEEADVVIAWGSSLSGHMNTVETKADLLGMMKDKGLQARVKCIVAGTADEEAMQGTHPLFPGLHYGREEWRLKAFDIDKALGELEAVLGEKAEKKKGKNKKSEKKEQKMPAASGEKTEKKKAKGGKANVSENQKQAGCSSAL